MSKKIKCSVCEEKFKPAKDYYHRCEDCNSDYYAKQPQHYVQTEYDNEAYEDDFFCMEWEFF